MTVQFFNESEVQLIKTNSTDEDVARAAWVSTLGEDALDYDPARMSGLINYLMRDRHGSPFEHGSFTFFVKTPLFVRSEFHRHRVGWSYNEESGRYSKMKPHFYTIPEGRKLTQSGKPGHYVFAPGTEEQFELVRGFQEISAIDAYSFYERMLDRGVAKEVARMHLPLHLMTSFYATCNPRSLMHFLGLRTKHEDATFPSNPQFEINDVASKMEAEFEKQMPITYAAWQKNGRVAP